MQIAFITPEVLPYSKTGGLADVALALPAVLADAGAGVTVFSPLHRQAKERLGAAQLNLEELKLPFELWIGRDSQPVEFLVAPDITPRQVFIVNDHYFDRPHPYLDDDGQDYPDNVARYAYFCRAVLEYCRQQKLRPDVFHCNDWQSALVPAYLKHGDYAADFTTARSVLTIHNLGYQGLFPSAEIYATGLDWDVFTPDHFEFYDNLNLLKGGISFADALTTVSPTYAREIQTEEFGHGLHGVLTNHGSKLTGIVNGIDPRVWNPRVDMHLPAGYHSGAMSGKKTCRRLLQSEMGLPVRSSCLLLGVISRLDRQKGIDLVSAAFRELAALDLQLVVLGSGDAELQAQLELLAADFPDQVAVRIGYDEPLAHRIIAGSDAFLMPSRYEPCGLTQLYSQAYGTVPIVRSTGGLADTVTDYTPRRLGSGRASGFAFPDPDAAQLAAALRRAAKLYFTDHKAWNKLMKLIMRLDRSWQNSAAEYLAVYDKLAQAVPAAPEVSHV